MSDKNNPLSLESQSIGRLLMQYSIPAVIASTVTSLYNIVDSIFIGHGVGALAISGLAITFPLMNLVVAFCTLIAVGGATVCSIFLGQRNIIKATDTLTNVLVLCLVHSILFGGLTLLFLDSILIFFGATDATISYAREFMSVILYATPITYVFIGLNNIMRATGYPKKAMISALLSVIVNMILAPIFIFIFEWGIKGAALATVFGQTIALVWVLAHFLSKSSYIHFKIEKFKIDFTLCKRMYSIGLSPFLMNICACVVVIFINKALLEYGGNNGDLAVGAYGILNRTAMLFVMVVFGVTQGMQPILGYNYGANRWDRVKQTLHIGVIVGMSITTIGWLICELFPNYISNMFTDDLILKEIANNGFRIFFIFFPIVGGQIIIQNFFQSIGMPKISIFLSLTRQLIFLVPFLIILPQIFGINGVWFSVAAADILAVIVTIITLFIQIRKLNIKFTHD